MPQWRDLAKFLAIAESDDLQWDRKLYVCLDHQSAKYRAHLLKSDRNFTAVFFPGIRDYGKVRRLYFNPMGIGRSGGKPYG